MFRGPVGSGSGSGFGFNEGFEAVERVVPLGGDAVEVVAELVDGLGVELKEGMASGADAADNSGALEDAQVLGDGLAGEVGAVGELGDGASVAAAEFGEEGKTSGIAERGEGRCGLRPCPNLRDMGDAFLSGRRFFDLRATGERFLFRCGPRGFA